MSTSDRILKIHFWELCRVISNDNTSYFARYAWTLFSKLNWWLLSLLKEHPIVRHQVRGREKRRKRGSLPKQPSYFAPHRQDISQGEETSLAAGTTREGCFHRLEERERGGFLRSNPSLFFLLISRWTVPSTWKPQGCRLSTRPLWPLDCSSGHSEHLEHMETSHTCTVYWWPLWQLKEDHEVIPILRSLPAKERLATPPGSTTPTFLEQYGFFYAPQEPDKWKCCEMWPDRFYHYSSRLESLTACRCHYKGSTFFSLI